MVVAKLGVISPVPLLFCSAVSAVCVFALYVLRASQSARRQRIGSVVLRVAFGFTLAVMVLQVLAFLYYARGSLTMDMYRLMIPVYLSSVALSGACLAIALVAMAYVGVQSLRR